MSVFVTFDHVTAFRAVSVDAERWNGFHNPRVDVDGVNAVAAWLAAQLEDAHGDGMRLQWDGSSLVVVYVEDGAEVERYAIEPDGDGLYLIGYGFTWQPMVSGE